MHSELRRIITMNFANLIRSSKSWVRLSELSAFYAISQISF
ncbi:hypothetical protein [Rubritalea tangerina]